MIRNNRITCLQYATITIIIMLGFLFSSYVPYSYLIHRHVVFSLRHSRRELHACNTYATIAIIIMFKFLCSSYSPHPYLRHRHLLFSRRHSRQQKKIAYIECYNYNNSLVIFSLLMPTTFSDRHFLFIQELKGGTQITGKSGIVNHYCLNFFFIFRYNHFIIKRERCQRFLDQYFSSCHSNEHIC